MLLSAAYPPGIPNHNWGVTATAATNIGHQALLSAARYLAAAAIDLIEQPEQLDAMKQEFKDRTEGVAWASMIPDGTQPPLYEPPAGFLKATGQSWPPKGVTWPVPPVVSTEQLGTTGPNLPPVT